MKENLEKVLEKKIIPMVNSTTNKALGKTFQQLNEDISSKFKRIFLGNITIDFESPFKVAKREFKKEFLTNLIMKNCGNVSEVARMVDVDRRSIHRLVDDIDIKEIRQNMPRAYQLKQNEIIELMEETIEEYRAEIPQHNIDDLYRDMPKLADNIIKELPIESLTLKEAEEEFEREYLGNALSRYNFDVMKTATSIGLRYETLWRKIRVLGFA